MWPEVEQAMDEQRHELVLQGAHLSDQIDLNDGHLDEEIFSLVKLNFLELSKSKLCRVPDSLGALVHLTNLVLKNNKLTALPDTVNSLTKLKLLDVSDNQISSLPSLSNLNMLTTLNMAINSLEGELVIPGMESCEKLTIVDVSGNALTCLGSLESSKLPHLSELVANHNQLESLSADIAVNWPLIKKLDLSNNKLKEVDGSLGHISKLKELSLVNNPLKDNRLRKMCEQKGTKAVLDYIKANSGKEGKGGGKGGKKGKKGGKQLDTEEVEEVGELLNTLSILSFSEEYPEILVSDLVREVRPYIVCCYVSNLDLTGENLKKFLSVQTKLHKGMCKNRTLATIATHDKHKLNGPLLFTAKPPAELSITPLMSSKVTTADKLVTQLKSEAEALRKEKKRSNVTGLHQYLHLLDSWTVYPCLTDSDTVISFPPVTNSDNSRISETTTTVMIEVTASSKLDEAKMVMDQLLVDMTDIWPSLSVIQARVLSQAGELKVTYPSKTDLLNIPGNKIRIIRP